MTGRSVFLRFSRPDGMMKFKFREYEHEYIRLGEACRSWYRSGWGCGHDHRIQSSVADPDREATLIKLKEASSYKRADIVMEANWAQMPGATSTDRNLAGACAEKIVEDL